VNSTKSSSKLESKFQLKKIEPKNEKNHSVNVTIQNIIDENLKKAENTSSQKLVKETSTQNFFSSHKNSSSTDVLALLANSEDYPQIMRARVDVRKYGRSFTAWDILIGRIVRRFKIKIVSKCTFGNFFVVIDSSFIQRKN
jgi:hypothetical protein